MVRTDEVSVVQQSIAFEELSITVENVASAMGYTYDTIPPILAEEIRELLLEAPQHCSICGGYDVFDCIDISFDTGLLMIDKKVLSVGKSIAARLAGSELVALFVCTAGQEFTTWARQQNESGEMVKGYVVDTIGSEVVERSMDLIQNELRNKQQLMGRQITNRYSPGYCEWSVGDQGALFSLLPSTFCGVNLTESSLMIPIKSISGVIGIGSSVDSNGYACDLCGLEHCYKRRKTPH